MRLSEQLEIVNRFTRTAPVDVISLARALGVDVHYAYLDEDISGMLERRDGERYVITVNDFHHSNRQRFTIAHELGHYVLHRHLVGDGVDDDRAYRSTNKGKYHNTLIGPKEETEANKFAASVLMPFGLVKARRLEGASPDQIAAEFGVSEQAMQIRLGLR